MSNNRGRRATSGQVQPGTESLEDLLRTLEPDAIPAPSSASASATLSTSELEDLIAGLDDVVVNSATTRSSVGTQPRTLSREMPPKGADDLDDLLKELETEKTTPARPGVNAASSSTSKSSSSSSSTLVESSSPIAKDIQSLLSPSEGAQELALRNIVNFCLEEPNRVAVRQLGGIPFVVKLLPSPNAEIQTLAAHALANLALHPDNRTAVRECRGNEALVRLLAQSSHDPVREKVLTAIANLCVDDPANRQEFIKAGLTKTVVSVLAGPSSSDDVSKRALMAIVNTSFDPLAQRELASCGGIQVIIPLVNSSNLEKQTNAAWALAALTMGGPEIQKALYEAGALPAFVRLLSSGNPNAEIKALTALVNLSGNDSLQLPIHAAKAIPAIIPHISSPHVGSVRFALQTLQNLALNGECRGAIQASGGVAKVMQLMRSTNCNNKDQLETLPHALRVVINLTGDPKVRRAFVDENAIPLVERFANERDPTVSQCAKQALNNLKIPC